MTRPVGASTPTTRYGVSSWSPPPSASPCDPAKVPPTRSPVARATSLPRTASIGAAHALPCASCRAVVRDERGLGADDAESPVAVAERHRNHLAHERTARELLHGGERHVPRRHVGVIDAGQHELQRAALGADDEIDPGGLAHEPLFELARQQDHERDRSHAERQQRDVERRRQRTAPRIGEGQADERSCARPHGRAGIGACGQVSGDAAAAAARAHRAMRRRARRHWRGTAPAADRAPPPRARHRDSRSARRRAPAPAD